MKTMKKAFLIFSSILFLIGCKKANLDNLAFPSQKLDSYQLDNYEGEIPIPESYNIPDNMVNIFSLPSYSSETNETYNIYCIYIGDMSTLATDTVILYAHGQSKHMDTYWSRAKLLANIGSKNQYGVLMMDYRGYGMSEGNSTEIGLNEDVETCVNWLKQNGVQPQNTIYYGYSLGVIPSIYLAAYKSDFVPSKLIIESPLASVEYLTQSSTVLNVDSKFVTSLEFNNAERIKDITMPLCWFHGVIDDYIAIENGEIIYNNYQGSYKEAHKIDGANHSDIPVTMGYENYLQTLHDFIVK
jgi:hypothetical protein